MPNICGFCGGSTPAVDGQTSMNTVPRGQPAGNGRATIRLLVRRYRLMLLRENVEALAREAVVQEGLTEALVRSREEDDR